MGFENPEFDYVVGGIEDGIIQVLSDALLAPRGYLRTIQTYGGSLDAETLRSALGELVGSLPVIYVCYADGEDKPNPQTPPVAGEPFVVTHSCSFSIIACSDDARGEKARRRGSEGGAYKMLADARRLLSGLQFSKQEEDAKVLLNDLPLTPAGVDYIARLPDLTAYAQHFDTTFKYQTPDRHTVREGTSIDSTVVVRDEGSQAPAQGAPGVVTVNE